MNLSRRRFRGANAPASINRSRFAPLLAGFLLGPVLCAQGVFEKRVSPVSSDEAQKFQRQVKVALVVGVSRYPAASGFTQLAYAASDATEIGNLLKQQGYLVRVLTDNDAMRGSIEHSLHELGDLVDPNQGTFLFFFSGHGFAFNGRNYLAPVSSSTNYLDQEGLAVDAIEQMMVKSKARRQLMLLDACRDDASSQSKGGVARSFDSFQAAEGLRILNSTRLGHVSYESDELRHGVFSEFVLKALQGAAAGADGLVTFRDLADYVTDSVRRWGVEHNKVQVPYEAVGQTEASGDFLLVKLTGPAALDVSALVKRGEEFFRVKDFASALPLFKQAANAGDARGMAFIGILHMQGWGVTQNFDEAMSWNRKAADKGDGQGMSNIGIQYAQGLGVTKDCAEAMRWYKKAVDTGNSDSMANVGGLYLAGCGVPQDSQEGLRWYQKAADAGNIGAMAQIGWLYANGQGVTQNYEEALRWYRKAVDAGDLSSMDEIGWLYQNGNGVNQDYPEAMRWYRKAADAGNGGGMNDIGLLYEKGLGVNTDYGEAMRWFRRALDAGSAMSMDNIGWLYENGLGVAKDYHEAMRWYEKAADTGLPDSMDDIGRLYEQGRGVHKDLKRAITWYRKAASAGDEDAVKNLKRLGVEP